MDPTTLSFLTPYWSGSAMMRAHLASIRQFHRAAPLLVSKRGRDEGEMEQYARESGVEYWQDDGSYTDAYLRLLLRCRTPYACILDHDTILLAPVDGLVDRVESGRADLVGVEERIRWPADGTNQGLTNDGWLRFAPGQVAANFLIFNWAAFRARWGLRGVFGSPIAGAHHFDFDYGVGQRLRRHSYLRPYHTPRYGLGNLLQDGDRPAVWHQWYGSYRTRLAGADPAVHAQAETGERQFLADYPRPDFSMATPAWGPEFTVTTASNGGVSDLDTIAARARRAAGRELRVLRAHVSVALSTRRP